MLSTCNRIEVYAVVDAFHGGLADVSTVLGRHSGLPLPELTEHLYVHYAGSAVQHLFAVAAGLDSMVIGEAQILGQLRAAYAAADAAGTVGRTLHELSQQALRVGKRVHACTGIDAAGASIVSEALAAAAEALGRTDLAGVRAVLVGAGAMGALAAAHLRRAGAAEVVVLNRSAERAQRLVEITRRTGTPARQRPALDAGGRAGHGGPAGGLHGRGRHGRRPRDVVAAAVVARDGRPLAVCDLGLPRDVDPAVAALPGRHRRRPRRAAAPGSRSARRTPRSRGRSGAGRRRGAGLPGRAALGRGHPDGDGAAPPRVGGHRRRAAAARLAAARRSTPRCATSSSARCAASSTSCCTPRRCRSSGWPRVRTAAATRTPCASCSSSTRRRPPAVAVQRHGDVLAALEAPVDAPKVAPGWGRSTAPLSLHPRIR